MAVMAKAGGLVAAALLLGGAALLLGDALPLARGEVIERLECAGLPGQSYALYLPRAYGPERRWPILYAFDARERGRLAVERFRDAAEELGWIVAASNNSRSDEPTMDGNVAAMKALWEDTHARLALDGRRIYATGFSGGARVACLLGLARAGEVAGVVGCGGGFPSPEAVTAAVPFAFLGVAGDADFNFHELVDLDRRLGELGVRHRFLSFPGGHDWPPAAMAREALLWLELLAMQAGTAPVRAEFVAARFAEALAAAGDEEAAGDPVAALRRLEAAARDFRGLRETEEFETRVGRLRASPQYARERAAQEAAESRYSAYLARASARLRDLLAEEPRGVNLRDLLARLEVPNLERRAAEPTYAGRSARRALETLFVQTSFYLPRRMSDRGDEARAALLLQVAAAVKPGEPWVWYALARAQARSGEGRGALASLGKAVDAGFADGERLAADPAFARLRNVRRFRALLAELEGAGP
jgi:predicted esterase